MWSGETHHFKSVSISRSKMTALNVGDLCFFLKVVGQSSLQCLRPMFLQLVSSTLARSEYVEGSSRRSGVSVQRRYEGLSV
jgi:hypothetical protein